MHLIFHRNSLFGPLPGLCLWRRVCCLEEARPIGACFGKDSDRELTKSNEWVWAYSNARYRKTQTDTPRGEAQQIGYGFALKRVASTGGDDCRSTHPLRPHYEPTLFLA